MYLKEDADNTITIEKSRFICYMKHVKNEQEYRDFLAEIRKKHYDASHVCSALVCGNIQRSSDDGEPSGTAGAPILNILVKNHLDETCALVVRYFGGIKLGASGLIRAYGNAVKAALENAVLAEDVEYDRYSLTLSYELANKVDYYLRNSTILLDTEYGEEVTYDFATDNENILNDIQEYTRGIRPEYIGKKIITKVVE